MLEPVHSYRRTTEATAALTYAHNAWQAEHWLDGKNNWHERWRGSICVAIEDPDGAAREIERSGPSTRTWCRCWIKAEPNPPGVTRDHDPVWAAATKHDITVSCHLGRGVLTPADPPVGYPSYNHDFAGPARCWPPTR